MVIREFKKGRRPFRIQKGGGKSKLGRGLLPPCFPRKPKGFAGSDEALDFVGGANRDRTGDLYNAIVALSQLSYGPMKQRPRGAGRVKN